MKNAPVFFRSCEYILVNGILKKLGGINGWGERCEMKYANLLVSAIGYDYSCGAITRFTGQNKRVADLSVMMTELRRPKVYVGHSNGCELFSRLLRKSKFEFVTAHLFAPAVDSDFEVNGFNEALRTKQLGSLYIYGSTKDYTLRNGKWATGWLKPLGLGYGDLGFAGAQNIDPKVRHLVHNDDWNNDFKHSDWFKPEHINQTIQLTLRK